MAVDFSQKNPDDVLKTESLDEYRAKMTEFHLRLTSLKVDLFIVQKIVDFPLGMFTVLEDGLFLNRVVQNFGLMAVLKITAMATDQVSDARTLPKFKKFMYQAIKDEFRDEYRQLLKGVKFGARTESLLEKAKTLRNTQIAHALRDPAVELGEDEIMTFGEVKSLADELVRLFDVASFSSEYYYLPASYDPRVQHPVGSDSRPDIEKILDSIARESGVIRSPENHPERWPHRRERWSQAKIDLFNAYRRKFGLPEV
jgi:hypothetical protein